MLHVGLTGGIACGKSLIAGWFTELGIPVVNDDVAAHDAVAPGTQGLAEIVAEFGSDVLAPDGSLDRPRLGRRIFADDGQRRRLMEITFPFIDALVAERIQAAEASNVPMVVYESALLIENGIAERWRPLVVVTVTREVQLERLCARSDLSVQDASNRIQSQMAAAEKARLADYAIDNSGTRAATRARFDEVFAALTHSR